MILSCKSFTVHYIKNYTRDGSKIRKFYQKGFFLKLKRPLNNLYFRNDSFISFDNGHFWLIRESELIKKINDQKWSLNGRCFIKMAVIALESIHGHFDTILTDPMNDGHFGVYQPFSTKRSFWQSSKLRFLNSPG